MKRVFALLALVGAVAFGAPAWAEEKAAETAAPVATAAAPAARGEVAPRQPGSACQVEMRSRLGRVFRLENTQHRRRPAEEDLAERLVVDARESAVRIGRGGHDSQS